MTKQNTRMTVWVMAAIASVVLLAPFPTTLVPEWRIQVIDMEGEPVSNVQVKQEWSYSETLWTSEAVQMSNELGIVVFPERHFYAPLSLRIFARSIDIVNNAVMPHGARTGVYSSVRSSAGSYYWLEYRSGQELPGILILRKL